MTLPLCHQCARPVPNAPRWLGTARLRWRCEDCALRRPEVYVPAVVAHGPGRIGGRAELVVPESRHI